MLEADPADAPSVSELVAEFLAKHASVALDRFPGLGWDQPVEADHALGRDVPNRVRAVVGHEQELCWHAVMMHQCRGADRVWRGGGCGAQARDGLPADRRRATRAPSLGASTIAGVVSESPIDMARPEGIEREKQLAAQAAAQIVESGMTVGLGTGSTAAYLLTALAARDLDLRCVATSPATSSAALGLGMKVVPFTGPDAPARLDVAIDGADQVAPSGWLVKGGGAAHTREKAVAAAADRFVVIVSSNKLIERLSPPIPLELAEFGLAATLGRLQQVRLREATRSPDGGVIADYLGEFDDPEALADWLSSATGVVDHGLFPAAMVAEVLVGRGEEVERITPPRR